MSKALLRLISSILLVMIILSLTACSAVKEEVSKHDASRYVGEWYAKESGYFVFSKDKSFKWYKDNSKSENNVIIGKWKVVVVNQPNETIPHIILTKYSVTMDGTKTVVEDPENDLNKIDLAVFEYNESKMGIYNLNTQVEYNLDKQ